MSLLPAFEYSAAAHRAGLCLPLGLFGARCVAMQSLQAAVEVEKASALERLRNAARDLIARRVARFDDFFAAHGYSCPLPHQLRAVGKKGFPTISPGVDALLVCEMATGVLMGVQDLDAVEGGLVYTVARGGETFHGMRDVVTCKKDEIVLRDGRSVIASYFRGPDRRINITPATTSLLFFVFGAPDLDPAAIGDAIRLAADIIAPHAGEVGAITFDL